MIEIIGGAWAAGETKTFHISGEYLEILEAQYPVDVMLMDRAGAQQSIMRNSEASFFSRPVEGFEIVQITSAQAQAVRVFIGSGDAGTRRISSVVRVVDGNVARTEAGVSHVWRPNSPGAAGLMSYGQLWNPVGSGVRLVVDSVLVAAAAATGIAWGANQTQIGAVDSFSVSSLRVPLVPGSVAEGRSGGTVANLSGVTYLGAAFVQAGGVLNMVWSRPLVLYPGYGMFVVADVPNVSITGQVQFYREVI
jgi:hypothetical protein